MGMFSTTKLFFAPSGLIEKIGEDLVHVFRVEGYEVSCQTLFSGGVDISVSKGGFFKAVLGMKSALKVSILPSNGQILVEAGVGIFGQQAVPTIISMFIYWPVLIPQIWGMIQQAQLDDRVMLLVAESIAGNNPAAARCSDTMKKCVRCGQELNANTKFCNRCGAPQ